MDRDADGNACTPVGNRFLSSVTVHSSTRTDGAHLHVAPNWSWEATVVTVPTDLDVVAVTR